MDSRDAIVRLSDVQAKGDKESAIDLAPNRSAAYAKLAGLKYYKTPLHPHVLHMRDLVESKALVTRHERVCLYFALGTILDQLGLYEEAFKAFKAANESDKRMFNTNELTRYVNQVTDLFQRQFVQGKLESRPQCSAPLVFVVGMPRSGSTLVEQILASHSLVIPGGERRDIVNLISKLVSDLKAKEGYPLCLRRLDRAAADNIASYYLNDVIGRCNGGMLFIDKTLSNYLELGLLYLLFPGARFIHCKRNALDTCLSCYFQNFVHVSYANNLRILGLVYQEYQRLMAHWRAVLPINILEVEYEMTVNDVEFVTRSILEYCGLPWEAGCLEFFRTQRSVLTASIYQVKSPIYGRSVLRWKNYEPYITELREMLE